MNAKIISSTKLRDNFASILDTIGAKHSFYIITHNGKQEHAIISLDKLEDLLVASDSKYLKEIADARKQAEAGELFVPEDVFGNV